MLEKIDRKKLMELIGDAKSLPEIKEFFVNLKNSKLAYNLSTFLNFLRQLFSIIVPHKKHQQINLMLMVFCYIDCFMDFVMEFIKKVSIISPSKEA